MSEFEIPEKIPDAVPVSQYRDTFLNGFVSDSEVRDITLMTLQARWPDLVGPISKHSYPAEVRDHRLYVRIEKAVYAQDFNLAIPQILRAIKSQVQSIREIVIQKGRFEPGVTNSQLPDQLPDRTIQLPADVSNLLDRFRSGS
ncbi:MAG: DUF721 domain-containing protein [Spirochaetia bacterium]|nr:DUF721 domain-containing protein [Spirochaetia bacterium]